MSEIVNWSPSFAGSCFSALSDGPADPVKPCRRDKWLPKAFRHDSSVAETSSQKASASSSSTPSTSERQGVSTPPLPDDPPRNVFSTGRSEPSAKGIVGNNDAKTATASQPVVSHRNEKPSSVGSSNSVEDLLKRLGASSGQEVLEALRNTYDEIYKNNTRAGPYSQKLAEKWLKWILCCACPLKIWELGAAVSVEEDEIVETVSC